jgi:hypothetical protein
MQTFLPYADYKQSASCLDNKRLGKQRVEAWQIYLTLQKIKNNESKIAWAHHPAVLMWQGCERELLNYCAIMIEEWKFRGFNDTMHDMVLKAYLETSHSSKPFWAGNAAFHASHRSNLLRKDKEFYGKFNWTEPDNLKYVWPMRWDNENKRTKNILL